MRTEKEIQERMIECQKEIDYWSNERWKIGTSDGYKEHCAEVVTSFQSEKSTLKWVLSYDKKAI